MTQHTGRDAIWDVTMRTAISKETFHIEDIFRHESVSVSKRTVRDTMKTMSDLGWITKENKKQWKQGGLLGDGVNPTVDSGETEEENFPDAKKLPEHFTSQNQLEKDEVYFATVDKVSGNALIWFDEPGGSHINLGPIDESAVGEQVRFRYVSGVWGECLDEEYTYDGYDPKDGISASKSASTKISSGPWKSAGKSSHNGTITETDPDNKNKLLNGKL